MSSSGFDMSAGSVQGSDLALGQSSWWASWIHLLTEIVIIPEVRVAPPVPVVIGLSIGGWIVSTSGLIEGDELIPVARETVVPELKLFDEQVIALALISLGPTVTDLELIEAEPVAIELSVAVVSSITWPEVFVVIIGWIQFITGVIVVVNVSFIEVPLRILERPVWSVLSKPSFFFSICGINGSVELLTLKAPVEAVPKLLLEQVVLMVDAFSLSEVNSEHNIT